MQIRVGHPRGYPPPEFKKYYANLAQIYYFIYQGNLDSRKMHDHFEILQATTERSLHEQSDYKTVVLPEWDNSNNLLTRVIDKVKSTHVNNCIFNDKVNYQLLNKLTQIHLLLTLIGIAYNLFKLKFISV